MKTYHGSIRTSLLLILSVTIVLATKPARASEEPAFLFGSLGDLLDYNPAGMAEAFSFTALDGGSANTINIYIDYSSNATKVVIGLYDNAASDQPSHLLTKGTLINPVRGAWNSVAVPAVEIQEGEVYWIAVLGPVDAGTLRFRDVWSGGKCQTSLQTDLTTLPADWTAGMDYTNSPLSAYVEEVAAERTILFGAIGDLLDQNPPGMAEAFTYTALESGTANMIHVFIDQSSEAEQIVVGLYSNTSNNEPGDLLTSGSLSSPASGVWNTVIIPPVEIMEDSIYWIAVLGPIDAGTFRFRDVLRGAHCQTSFQTNLTTLPTSWTPGTDYLNSPMMAYVDQSADDPLPVQLSSFSCKMVSQHEAKLDWTTLTETNNYGFEVQRSSTKREDYQTISNSFVAGHGTSLAAHSYSFIDASAAFGNWYYRLKQMDLDGMAHYTDGIRLDKLTAVRDVAPMAFGLLQNYPNPFNPSTEIKFSVETTGRATLSVYNVLGQLVTTLFDEVAEAGQSYEVKFEADNLASGIYFFRLRSGSSADLKKMILAR